MTYLILADGSLQVFGRAPNGQLGLGKDLRCVRIPQRINIPGRLKELRVGSNLTLALNVAGDVFQWGTFLLWDEEEEVRLADMSCYAVPWAQGGRQSCFK